MAVHQVYHDQSDNPVSFITLASTDTPFSPQPGGKTFFVIYCDLCQLHCLRISPNDGRRIEIAPIFLS